MHLLERGIPLKVIAEVPHKILFSGSYTILDDCPALALAVGPRMTLKLVTDEPTPWPRQNPFAQAVREEIIQWLQVHHPERNPDDITWGSFRSHVPMPIEGWGVGSSASFTTALVLSQLAACGISLSPRDLFLLARRAHRRGQGGKGSGIDIAACAYGEVVRVAQAGSDADPTLERLCWPAHTGVLLIRSGNKADTRDAITAYFGNSLAYRRRVSRHLIRAVGQVCRVMLNEDEALIPALQENAAQEKEWSKAVGIPLVTDLEASLEEAFAPLIKQGWVAIKSLGAGGGDSIGCFYRRDEVMIADLMDLLQDFALQVRPATIERQGATLLCPPSPFQHAPDLGSPCGEKDMTPPHPAHRTAISHTT
jgi:mevalonate kinase